MHCFRTLAVRRMDRARLDSGASQLRRERLSASELLRAACAAGAGGAAGHCLFPSRAGTGRRSSRCRPSRVAWSCARCSAAPVPRVAARRQATTGSRRASYAVKRYLFRLGHAGRSARYATSIAQLVVGLAPVMGWGPVPRGGPDRARFVRAHRRSVQRWLDDLQAAGLVVHEPERDEGGRWWRTQIVLLRAPAPSADELAVARAARPPLARRVSEVVGGASASLRPRRRSASAVPSRAHARAPVWRSRARPRTERVGARRPRRRSPPRRSS